jgi:hypothetical protein
MLPAVRFAADSSTSIRRRTDRFVIAPLLVQVCFGDGGMTRDPMNAADGAVFVVTHTLFPFSAIRIA